MACALLCIVLGAYGVTPTVIGVLSDALEPRLGQQSLRAAMSAIAVVPLFATFIYVRLVRAFKSSALPKVGGPEKAPSLSPAAPSEI